MSGEKTEQPSAKRLRDARDKGQVPKSQEVGSTFVVLAVFGYVWIGYGFISDKVTELILIAIGSIGQPFDAALKELVSASFWNFALVCAPLLLIVMTAAVVGNMIQIGVLFAFESVKPNLDKINPKNWFKKVFAVKNLMEFFKSLLKMTVITVVFYKVFYNALKEVLLIPYWGVSGLTTCLGEIMKNVVLYCSPVFVVIAALDYLLQRHFFMKENMMSKEDQKNEYKEMEGDPHIKGKRKQLHQEMVMGDSMNQVRKSDVLVTNPTHLAIALQYKKGETPLPIIAAKGEGAIAERMMKIAEEEGIPIMRNVPLAHDLWEQGRVMEYIPSDLIAPVAEVLKWLQQMKDEGRI
jgi:type III secretion protein U